MRLIAIFLICASAAFGQSHEVLRPAVDASSVTTAIGCSGSNQSSSAMANSHDASGLSTSSSISATGTITVTRYKVRIFSSWAAPTSAYTALSLKVNTSGTETNNTGTDGVMAVAYSLNSGSTWTNIRLGGGSGNNWTQTTDTVTLSAAQDFTKLQVAVCVQGSAGGDTNGTTDTIVAWDIWTDGTFTGGAVGNGSSQGVPAIQPILISEFADLRRKYV